MEKEDLLEALRFMKRVGSLSLGFSYFVMLDRPGGRTPNHQAYVPRDPKSVGSTLVKQVKKNPTNGVFYTPFAFSERYHPEGGNLRKHDGYKTGCRVLWVDIDIGDGKHYPDMKTGLRELLSLRVRPNIVVDTGGGLHGYWVLDGGVMLARWAPLAERMKQWLKDSGIKGDLGITPDSGRVLRVPGTYNMKTGTPRRCRVLKDFGDFTRLRALEYSLPEISNLETPSNVSGLFAADDNLVPEEDRRPSYSSEIVNKCLVLNAIGVNRGAGDDEPLWKDALGAIARTEDASAYAHILSDGHKDYHPASVDAKLAERAEHKPITCAQLGESYASCHGVDLCSQCPHNGVVKAPIALGYKDPEPEQLAEGPPWPLELRADGTYLHSKNKDGEKTVQKAMHERLTDARAVYGPGPDQKMIQKLICNIEFLGRASEQTFDILALGNPTMRTRYEHTTTRGLRLNKDTLVPVTDGLSSWYDQLKNAGQAVQPILSLGWFGLHKGEYAGFATGDQFIMRDIQQSEPYLEVSETLAHSYVAQGDVDVWLKAVEQMVAGGVQELLVPVYAAFASVLAPFNTDSSAVVNLFTDQSGVGKTTAMQVAASVWGDPTVAVNSMNDTVNALANKAATLNNLPLLWDEVRGNEDLDRHMMEFLFRIPQGRSKERMTGDGGKSNTFAKFRLMAVLASNMPINTTALEKGSDAAMARIFSVELPPGIKFEDPSKRHAFDDLRSNYGHAGASFVRYVAQNQADVKRMCRALDDKLRAKHKPKAADRMLVTTMAQLTAAAIICGHTGLIRNDVGAFITALEKQYSSMLSLHERLRTETSTVIPIEQYLNGDRVNGIVVSEMQLQKPGKPKNRDDKVVTPPLMGNSGIHYELCDKTGELLVDRGHFQRWANETHPSFKIYDWERRAEEEGILLDRKARVRLAAGTRHASKTQQYCYRVQLPDVGTGGRIKAVTNEEDNDGEENRPDSASGSH